MYRGFDSHIGFWSGHHDYFDHSAVESVSNLICMFSSLFRKRLGQTVKYTIHTLMCYVYRKMTAKVFLNILILQGRIF